MLALPRLAAGAPHRAHQRGEKRPLQAPSDGEAGPWRIHRRAMLADGPPLPEFAITWGEASGCGRRRGQEM